MDLVPLAVCNLIGRVNEFNCPPNLLTKGISEPIDSIVYYVRDDPTFQFT